jgi:hypothetical protein
MPLPDLQIRTIAGEQICLKLAEMKSMSSLNRNARFRTMIYHSITKHEIIYDFAYDIVYIIMISCYDIIEQTYDIIGL